MKLKKIFNIANVYILLWCFYFLQGAFYESGSIISRGILVVVLFISFYNFCVANIYYRLPIYFKGLNLLLVMFVIYWLILLGWGESRFFVPSSSDYIKPILISLLPIYSGYIYAKKWLVTNKTLTYWVPIWILFVTILFYYTKEQYLLEIRGENKEMTNNVGYVILAIMPVMVIFRNKPLLFFAGIVYCMLFIFMGMKRGAIFIGSLIFVYYLYFLYKKSILKNKCLVVLFAFLSIIAVVNMVEYLLYSSSYFNLRLEQTLSGDSSGRDNIFSYFWNYFCNQDNGLNVLFGNGAFATIKLYSIFAHNDWLEILICQGVIGFIIYFLYFYFLYRSWKRLKNNSIAYVGVGLIFLILILKTFISMSYNDMPIFLSFSLGFFLAQSNVKAEV